MHRVTSADGTRIAYKQHGDGPPLVLLHGGSGSHESFDRLVPHLAESFALLVGEHRDDDDLADRMQARLDEGDRRGAMRLFVEVAGDVDDAARLDWWPEAANIDRVATVVRENYAVESYRLPDEPTLEVPTLLLTGEHGPDHLRDAVFTLHERLPESRLVELDGVGHVATDSAPDRLAAEVRSFLDGTADAA